MPTSDPTRGPFSVELAAWAGAVVAVAALLVPAASAGQELPGEIRWHLSGGAVRRSSDVDYAGESDTNAIENSAYMDVGAGARVYPGGKHGLFVDAAYRFDIDMDTAFDESAYPGRVDFAVARTGYAFRKVYTRPRRAESRTLALTLRGGLVTGLARSLGVYDEMPDFSPVIGTMVGLDWDQHYGRWFFGWGLSLDLLVHTRGPMRVSQLVTFNVLPFFRMGVTFGPRVRGDPRRYGPRAE